MPVPSHHWWISLKYISKFTNPPSTIMFWPEIYEFSSLATNKTVLEISGFFQPKKCDPSPCAFSNISWQERIFGYMASKSFSEINVFRLLKSRDRRDIKYQKVTKVTQGILLIMRLFLNNFVFLLIYQFWRLTVPIPKFIPLFV